MMIGIQKNNSYVFSHKENSETIGQGQGILV